MVNKNMSTKDRIIKLLLLTERAGIEKLIEYLDDNEFFTLPASRNGHSAREGGLAQHSLDVMELLVEYNAILDLGTGFGRGRKTLEVKPYNLVIAALLHDVCKIGRYEGDQQHGYTLDPDHPGGHAVLSIKRVSKYIKLEPVEEMMIRFHMGVYGLKEFDKKAGEYRIRSPKRTGEVREESAQRRYGKSLANAWFHNPIVKMMYFCDEIATLKEMARDKAE